MEIVAAGAVAELTEVAFSQRLHLDIVEDTVVLTDRVTRESKRLPPKNWTLHFDDDTSSALLVGADEGADDQVLDVFDEMKLHLFENTATSKMYFKQAHDSKLPQSWDERNSKYKLGIVNIKSPSTSAVISVEAYIFRQPKEANQRACFDLYDIYRALCLSCYSKQPSKWVFASRPSWQRRINAHFDGTHYLFSCHDNNGEVLGRLVPASDRCTKSPAVTTLGLLSFLAQKAYRDPQGGGFRDPRAQVASSEILASLLHASTMHGTISHFDLYLDDDWRCLWPRPPGVKGAAKIQLTLEHPGKIDLRPLLSLAADTDNLVAVRWLIPLQAVGLVNGLSRLDDVLKVLAHSWTHGSFLAQILWGLSLRLERQFGVQGAAEEFDSSTHQAWFAWNEESNASVHEWASKLPNYIAASVTHVRGSLHFSIPNDEAQINGLPLHMATGVYPTNFAICAPPVVSNMRALTEPPHGTQHALPTYHVRVVVVYIFSSQRLKNIYTTTEIFCGAAPSVCAELGNHARADGPRACMCRMLCDAHDVLFWLQCFRKQLFTNIFKQFGLHMLGPYVGAGPNSYTCWGHMLAAGPFYVRAHVGAICWGGAQFVRMTSGFCQCLAGDSDG
jgi:hypothetical protein